jgi:hypothetical protein
MRLPEDVELDVNVLHSFVGLNVHTPRFVRQR